VRVGEDDVLVLPRFARPVGGLRLAISASPRLAASMLFLNLFAANHSFCSNPRFADEVLVEDLQAMREN
jgi:hypothetical protein